MGRSANIYFGPVIQCINSIKECFRDVKKCPKCKIPRFDSFCPACGSKIKIIKEPDKCYNVDVDSLDYNEQLYHVCYNSNLEQGVNFFIGNNSKKSNQYYSIYDDVYGDINQKSVQNINFAEEISKFSKVYGEEIQLLKNAYGDDNVSIDFRLLTIIM